jgi:hypothetical protein
MNEQERVAVALLARYAAEERPPPAVDASIRARLRAEASRPHRRVHGLAVCAFMAAALLLWWALGPAVLSRTVVRGDSAALHMEEDPDGRHAVVRDATPPSPPPILADDDDDDPGVTALRAARDLVRAGAYEQAFARLEPCPRTVGTDDLLEECDYLVLQALCGAGEHQEGRRRIATFHDRWPRSIHEPKLTELCK